MTPVPALPRHESLKPSGGSPLPSVGRMPLGRILVAEDDRAIRTLYTQVLTRGGYAVEVAEDGASAWEALQAGSYDLLITDNNMPRMCGLDLLRNVWSAGLSIPVIMATGVLPEAEFAQSPWLRPAALFRKPCPVKELLGAVNRVLAEAASVA